jgi:hypothetical protein
LPKLPLPWVIIIVLIAIIYLLLEGGYRLHQAERAKYAAQIARHQPELPARSVFSIEQYAKGLLTYARKVKAGDQPDSVHMFSKSHLQGRLGSDGDKIDQVMDHLVKSGHATAVPNRPDHWFID